MSFQIIKDDFYDKLPDILMEEIPEFITVFDKDDGAYLILGEFARFVMSNIDSNEILSKSFGFINCSIERGGMKTEDAIITQVFEQFYESEDIIILSTIYLKGKALDIFLKYKSSIL